MFGFVAGILSPNGARPIEPLFGLGSDDPSRPEGQVKHVDGPRLPIVDVAGGASPIFNEDKSVGIVCNGEVYNHRHLKSLWHSGIGKLNG